jgi:hypothetical protein
MVSIGSGFGLQGDRVCVQGRFCLAVRLLYSVEVSEVPRFSGGSRSWSNRTFSTPSRPRASRWLARNADSLRCQFYNVMLNVRWAGFNGQDRSQRLDPDADRRSSTEVLQLSRDVPGLEFGQPREAEHHHEASVFHSPEALRPAPGTSKRARPTNTRHCSLRFVSWFG